MAGGEAELGSSEPELEPWPDGLMGEDRAEAFLANSAVESAVSAGSAGAQRRRVFSSLAAARH